MERESKTIRLPDGYRPPTSQYTISSTEEDVEGWRLCVVYLVIGQDLHVLQGQILNEEKTYQFIQEISAEMKEFDRECRRKQVLAERDLAKIILTD